MNEQRSRDDVNWPPAMDRVADAAAATVTNAMRQLLPFASSDITGALPLMSRAAAPSTTIADVAPSIPAAGDIVSRAATILDEEMARGVLAARDVGGASSGGVDATAPGAVMKQLHEVVDNIARLWAPLARPVSARPTAAAPAAAGGDGARLPHLRAANALRPGERARISMTVRNNERQTVRLVPAVTPLLGSNGQRIPAQLVEFTPKEMVLEPDAAQDLRIDVAVPGLCAASCYSGLVVIGGVDYLRALLTIDVVGT